MSIVDSYETTNVPVERGASLQCIVAAAVHGIVSSIPTSGRIESNVIPSLGWQSGAVGLQSDQAGQLSVQRYLDQAGTIPVGEAIEASLIANMPGSVAWNDATPFGSFVVTIANSGSETAELNDLIVLLQSQ